MENKTKNKLNKSGAFWKALTKDGKIFYKGTVDSKISTLFINRDKETNEQVVTINQLTGVDKFEKLCELRKTKKFFYDKEKKFMLCPNKYKTQDKHPDLVFYKIEEEKEIPDDKVIISDEDLEF